MTSTSDYGNIVPAALKVKELNQDNFDNRLSKFSLYFIQKFLHKLYSYNMEVTTFGNVKVGKATRTVNWVLTNLIGPLVGGTATSFTLGIPGAAFGLKAGKVSCFPCTKLGIWYSNKRHKKKAEIVSKFVGNFDSVFDQAHLLNYLKILSSVAVDIFYTYGYQLKDANCNAGWQAAMSYVADDAVSRIMNYIYKQGTELLNEPVETVFQQGVRDGRSKSQLFDTVTLRYQGKKKTYDKNTDKWPVSELWTQPGIIHGNRCIFPDGCNVYKHGFRRPFCFETCFPETMVKEVRNTESANYILHNDIDIIPYKLRFYEKYLSKNLKCEIKLENIETIVTRIEQNVITCSVTDEKPLALNCDKSKIHNLSTENAFMKVFHAIKSYESSYNFESFLREVLQKFHAFCPNDDYYRHLNLFCSVAFEKIENLGKVASQIYHVSAYYASLPIQKQAFYCFFNAAEVERASNLLEQLSTINLSSDNLSIKFDPQMQSVIRNFNKDKEHDTLHKALTALNLAPRVGLFYEHINVIWEFAVFYEDLKAKFKDLYELSSLMKPKEKLGESVQKGNIKSNTLKRHTV